MGYSSDIKTLFFIMNTMCCLVPGALLFGYGVGAEALTGSRYNAPKVQIAVGLLFIVLANLGYCGAIAQNKKKLYIYGTAMLLSLIVDVVGVTLTCRAASETFLDTQKKDCMLIICHILVTLLSMGLSFTAAFQAPACADQPTSQNDASTNPLGNYKFATYLGK